MLTLPLCGPPVREELRALKAVPASPLRFLLGAAPGAHMFIHVILRWRAMEFNVRNGTLQMWERWGASKSGAGGEGGQSVRGMEVYRQHVLC